MMKPENYKKAVFTNTLFIGSCQGKMEGLHSISTWMGVNSFCHKMRNFPGTPCAECYAAKSGYKVDMVTRYTRNGEILSGGLIKKCQVPEIQDRFFRFETHGELINLTHFVNYLRIAKWFPKTDFTLWTKRLDIIRQAITAGYKCPKNLHIKLSSPFLGRATSDKTKKYFAEHGFPVTSFTVESIATLQEKGEDAPVITCGGRHCLTCQKCYGRHKYEDITELLKQDVTKAMKIGIDIGI